MAFAGGVAAFVVTSSPGITPALGFALLPLTAICVAKCVAFWLFAKALFSDPFGWKHSYGVALAAMVVAGLWHELDFGARARGGSASASEMAASVLYQAATLGFALAAVFETYRGIAGDLVEARRRLRVALVLGVAGYLAIVVGVQFSNIAGGHGTAALLVTANLVTMFVLSLAATLSLVTLRDATWLTAPRTRDGPALAAAASAARVPGQESPRALPALEARLLERLLEFMHSEKPWRREGLSVAGLAKLLGTQEHVLRRVVNGGLGYRNFNDFLHAYRIRDACEQLRAPALASRPVLSIALDAGYASIGPFNRAFRQRLGMTPTEYREAVRKGNALPIPESAMVSPEIGKPA